MGFLMRPALALIAIIFLALCGAASASDGAGGGPTEKGGAVEERWGIRLEGARLTAGGYMVDFRFRVIDPEKAKPLLERAVKPHLTDESTGARFMVPAPSKVGMLRQASNYGKIHPGNTYFVIFANPGRFLKPGAKVTVEIGEFKATNLLLQ